MARPRPSAKSIANLRPAKKGEVRNPLGQHSHNPVTKALKKLTVETYREMIELILNGETRELRRIAESANDPECKLPAIQVAIAMAFIKAMKSGDYEIIERIAARIVGKIPDELHVKSDNKNTNDVSVNFDPVKLKAAMLKIESEV